MKTDKLCAVVRKSQAGLNLWFVYVNGVVVESADRKYHARELADRYNAVISRQGSVRA